MLWERDDHLNGFDGLHGEYTYKSNLLRKYNLAGESAVRLLKGTVCP
jgi:hypothetical protein